MGKCDSEDRGLTIVITDRMSFCLGSQKPTLHETDKITDVFTHYVDTTFQ